MFLRILYGEELKEGWLLLWTKPDKRSRFYRQADWKRAALEAEELARNFDVYFGVGLQQKPLESTSRGTVRTVLGCSPGSSCSPGTPIP